VLSTQKISSGRSAKIESAGLIPCHPAARVKFCRGDRAGRHSTVVRKQNLNGSWLLPVSLANNAGNQGRPNERIRLSVRDCVGKGKYWSGISSSQRRIHARLTRAFKKGGETVPRENQWIIWRS
jgi:hypothetical protein